MIRTPVKEPVLTFKSAQELQTRMSREPRTSKGFWLKLSKAGAPAATITKDEAIETALCCGWIDGQLAKLDECYFLVRMTPRRPGSRWSAKNRAAGDRLAELGRLLPAGLAEVEGAKADDRWDAAYPSQGGAEPPEDLLASLRSNKAASRFSRHRIERTASAIIFRVERSAVARNPLAAHSEVCRNAGPRRDDPPAKEEGMREARCDCGAIVLEVADDPVRPDFARGEGVTSDAHPARLGHTPSR